MRKLLLLFLFPIVFSCNKKTAIDTSKSERAQIFLDSVCAHYQTESDSLLCETYPFDINCKVRYLAKDSPSNKYSYLWPYSSVFSAASVMLESDESNITLLEETVLIGLEKYSDTKRTPYVYASYINTAPASDRFYDDNVWIGIDFTDISSKQESKILGQSTTNLEFYIEWN